MPTPPSRHHAAPPQLAAALILLLFPLLLAGPAAAQPFSPPDKDNSDGEGGGGGGYTENQSSGFSAPMIVLLVALIVAFFLIGFFSVYMRRCGRGGASSSGQITISAAALLALTRQEQREQQQQRGLDPAVVASFPTMRYAEAKELRVGGKDAALECAVCLSEFVDEEELRFLPPCSHAFHPDCIGEWLAGHVTCPVCRCNLEHPDEDLAAAPEANSSGEEVAAAGEEQHQVAVDLSCDGVEEERRREEAMELERIGSQRRALRSRSGRPAPPVTLVPRSHSTGHSLATRLDGDFERFTLRLPEHVRREMVAAGEESLRRTGPGREREQEQLEGRAGGGARSARLGRSDRWPSFITRTFSSRVPFWPAASRRAAPDAEAPAGAAVAAGTTEPCTAATARGTKREKTADGGSVTPAKGSVRFDCLGAAASAVTGARVGAAAGDGETTEDEDEEKALARQA